MICTRAYRSLRDRDVFSMELNREVNKAKFNLSKPCPNCGGNLVGEVVTVRREGVTKVVRVARCARVVRYANGCPTHQVCFWVETDV